MDSKNHAIDFHALRWETIRKTKYRAEADIAQAKEEVAYRLQDRMEIPLPGLHGEKLFLTGYSALLEKAQELVLLYDKLPKHRGVQETILLDAWSSATIEGARTTVAQVKACFEHPKTKDDKMVVNAIKASNYAYKNPISQKNLRKLWDMVVADVCENEASKGTLYRDGMVYIGSADRLIHVPAKPEQLPELMNNWFTYSASNSATLLIRSFVSHFYFVYIHPFCDGNGRTARILNAAMLYHGGYKKMKSLPLAGAINHHIHGYYNSLTDSETVLNDSTHGWLDLSPFVFYMLTVFEHCLTDAALSKNRLNESEKTILTRMNKAGLHAEITVKKAADMLHHSQSAARTTLMALVAKGYLTVNTDQVPFLFRLQQHFTD